MNVILALAISTILILVSHRLANGSVVINVIASFLITAVMYFILPDLQVLPIATMVFVWFLYFVGLQFFMPGNAKVYLAPRATGIQFGRVLVAVAVV